MVACSGETSCIAGSCQCTNGGTSCGGTCFTTATDPLHCGGCSNACSSNHVVAPSCSAGKCNGACATNYADCDKNKLTNGCEIDVTTSIANCGGCGSACSTNFINANCTASSCNGGTCIGTHRDCNNNRRADGCEVDIATDPSHCGACAGAVAVCSGTNVAIRACAAGVCKPVCAGGYADCDAASNTNNGCETFVWDNKNHCGNCNTACGAGTTCEGTSCQRNMGTLVHPRLAVRLTRDLRHGVTVRRIAAPATVREGPRTG